MLLKFGHQCRGDDGLKIPYATAEMRSVSDSRRGTYYST